MPPESEAWHRLRYHPLYTAHYPYWSRTRYLGRPRLGPDYRILGRVAINHLQRLYGAYRAGKIVGDFGRKYIMPWASGYPSPPGSRNKGKRKRPGVSFIEGPSKLRLIEGGSSALDIGVVGMGDGDHSATASTTGRMGTEYVRRRGRRNYRFARFKAMVEAVLRSEIPRTVVLRNDTLSGSLFVINKQSWLGFTVLGCMSDTAYSNSSYYDDDILQTFFVNYGVSHSSDPATLNATLKHKEVYIRNVSVECQLINKTLATTMPQPLVCDVYLCAPKQTINKDIPGDDTLTGGVIHNTTDFFKTLSDKGATLATGAGNTTIHWEDRGFTPFQSPLWCKYFTILRKTKVQLGNSETYTFKLQKRVNRMFNWNEVASYHSGTNTITYENFWFVGASLVVLVGYSYPGLNTTGQLASLDIGIQKRIYSHKNNQEGLIQAETA